ncbi:MAG TPA: AI-2E family transporter [Gemmatimonadales bacterium]|jgi:predicted PurR-regulated permease PerM|nr:AI-2E family transporter [Gemmatimonadales bacterium]
MALIDSNHQRAALLVLLLGIALVVALTPYATGIIGIPVLYAIFAPAHDWLGMRMRPRLAATFVVVLALFLIVVPGVSFAGLIVSQAQEIAGSVVRNPLLGRLRELRVGGVDLGPRLADLGAQLVGWIGSSAFGLVGTATRLALNLTISLFGLFYLLLQPGETWEAVQPYIPFSSKNTEKLRQRFRDVTSATIIGTGLTAAIQGVLVGLGFWLTGLPNAVFWGVVTVVFAILPVVGSGLVWAPGALALILGGRTGPGLLLLLWGAAVVGNVDYVIRPRIFKRWANIHPLVTLLGALAGVPYFGILGLLIGPLALSYFFELVKMYGEEYLG